MQQCIRDGRTLKGNKNPMYGISRRGAANPLPTSAIFAYYI